MALQIATQNERELLENSPTSDFLLVSLFDYLLVSRFATNSLVFPIRVRLTNSTHRFRLISSPGERLESSEALEISRTLDTFFIQHSSVQETSPPALFVHLEANDQLVKPTRHT